MIGRTPVFEDGLFQELATVMWVVPVRMMPEPWEILAFTLCIPLLFAYVRLELSLRWLAVPFLTLLAAPLFKGFLEVS